MVGGVLLFRRSVRIERRRIVPGGTMPDTKWDLDVVGWVGASARNGIVVEARWAAGESGGSGEGKRDLERMERPCCR